MSGLEMMQKRMQVAGGRFKDSNVNTKLKSFERVLEVNSYQTEIIEFQGNKYKCLLNPSKLVTDYDQKEISINADMHNGDVFYWERTHTHWITFLQKLDEKAYFRAQARRCDYQVDVYGVKYWIYLRGPSEQDLNWSKLGGVELNKMNYSMLMFVTKTKETVEYFRRLQIIEIEEPLTGDIHRWRVAAADRYTQDGIIEVIIEEYFDHSTEDLSVKDKEVDNTEAIEKADPYIEGPSVIYGDAKNLTYIVHNVAGAGTFSWDPALMEMNGRKTKALTDQTYSIVLNSITLNRCQTNLVYTYAGGTVTLPITIQSI